MKTARHPDCLICGGDGFLTDGTCRACDGTGRAPRQPLPSRQATYDRALDLDAAGAAEQIQIRTAFTDVGKCCDCKGTIRAGSEFVIEPWPNGSGFDQRHYECPALADTTGPRVVQGLPPSKRRNA